jgi:hypothetical protein
MALPQSALASGEHKEVFGLTSGHHEDLTFDLTVRSISPDPRLYPQFHDYP